VLVVVAVVLLGVGFVNTVKSVSEGQAPVTAVSVKESLGDDLPVYPGAQLELNGTQSVLTSFRVMEKFSGKNSGSLFRGAGLYSTSDSQEKVTKYYESEMKKQGWTKVTTQNTGFNTQLQYKKGNEFGLVQFQKSGKGTGSIITLMRGGSEMVEMNRKQQEQSGGTSSP